MTTYTCKGLPSLRFFFYTGRSSSTRRIAGPRSTRPPLRVSRHTRPYPVEQVCPVFFFFFSILFPMQGEAGAAARGVPRGPEVQAYPRKPRVTRDLIRWSKFAQCAVFLNCFLKCREKREQQHAAYREAPKYQPTDQSLAAHTAPAWFKGAKLGIFIHW